MKIISPPIRISGRLVAKTSLILVIISGVWGGVVGKSFFLVYVALLWTWVFFADGGDSLMNSYLVNLLKWNRSKVKMRYVFQLFVSFLLILAIFSFIASVFEYMEEGYEWRAFSWPSVENQSEEGLTAKSDERFVFDSHEECVVYLAKIKEIYPDIITLCAAGCSTIEYRYECKVIR